MALVNIVPAMTSNTAPLGVAFASSAYASTPAWQGFATLNSVNGWLNNGDGFPVTLGYQSDVGHIVTAYDMYPWDADNFPSRCPKDFLFQGSNDGITWVTLDTQTGITSWVVGAPISFSFTNSTAYLSHRVYITSNNGNAYTGMRHLSIFSDPNATPAPAPAPAPTLTNIVPAMTSNTAPSGVAFASSAYASTPAWQGFATLNSVNGWVNNADGFPVILGYQSDVGHTVTAYDIYPWDADTFPSRCPKDFLFQGSNDGVSWVTLDTRTGITSWVVGTPIRFTFANTASFVYHRVYITANNGNAYTGMRHLSIFAGPAAATPPSTGSGSVIESADTASGSANYTVSTLSNIVPEMTDNTTPSGVAFASSFYVSRPPWEAFTAPGYVNAWLNNGDGLPVSIGYQSVAGHIATAYEIMPWIINGGANDRCPKDFMFQGSNDGVNYVTLDTQTGFTFTTSAIVRFNFTNTRSFLYHRLFITANVSGIYTGLRHLGILGSLAPAVSSSTGSGSIIESADSASGSANYTVPRIGSGSVFESPDVASGQSAHTFGRTGSGNVVEVDDVGFGLTRPFFSDGNKDRLAFKLGQWHRGALTPDYLVDSSVNHMRIVNGDPVNIKPTVVGSSDPYNALPGIAFESNLANSGLVINDSRFAAGYGDFLLGLNFKMMDAANTRIDQYLFDGHDASGAHIDGLVVYITGGGLVVSRCDGQGLIYSPLISSASTNLQDKIYIERHQGVIRIVLNGAVVYQAFDNTYFSSSTVTIGSSVNGPGNTNFNGIIHDLFFYNGVSPLYGHITPGLVAHSPIEHFVNESSWFRPSISNIYIADIDYGVGFQFNGDFNAVARLDSTFATGKFYWEAQSNYNTGPVSFGLVDALTDDDFVLGSNALSVGYQSNGSVLMGGSVVATFSPFTSANTVGIAVDMDSASPSIHFFVDGISKGMVSLPARTWRPAFSFNGGPEAIHFASDPSLVAYPQVGFSKLVSSLPSTRSSSGSIIGNGDLVVGVTSRPRYGFRASIDLPSGVASSSTFSPNSAKGLLSLKGSGYGGGSLKGKLSLNSSVKGTTISPGVMVATLKLKGVMSATTGSAAIGVSKIFLPSGSASGGGFIRSVSPLPSGQARGASGTSAIAVGRLVLTGLASASTYRPTIAIATIPLPRFITSSRAVSKISLPVGIANGRTYAHYKLVNGAPVETFNTDGWVLNLKKRNGDNPEKEPLCQASRWLDFPMRQMVRFHEDYYGIGFDGKLYKLGGKTDNGAPIEWKITTAMTDFGMIQRKAVGAVYLGASIENVVTVGIHQDELTEDPFLIPVTRGAGPHTARARLARGYDARYYGFSVSNSGGTADINTINLEIKPKERA